ncbi:MAG: serine/threonine protein kinase [Planctomycetia bacterium]|nr:serine/threonine protein kinase [Planctomycetia bacterium]
MSTVPEPREGHTPPISAPPVWTKIDETPIPAKVGEFEIVSKLGAGSFGQVFLAHQSSLGRQVAIKVFHNEHSGGSEGQLLAGLEHDNIVKVFSAFADADTGLHGLCLQYVPGADLGVVIRHIHAQRRAPKSGRAVIEALDANRRGDPGFDPAALRDRDALAGDDFAQCVCRIGGRLAEALAFAHARGILHCDIKPGNILLTPYGRPMLADFNVAFDSRRHKPEDVSYGGTIAYMAPEHRAAVYNLPGGRVDERCDVYSLGVVLYELSTGERPAPRQPMSDADSTVIPLATNPAISPSPEIHPQQATPIENVPRELAAVIERCLDPDPARRYQTATELASALSGAWDLLAARRALPAPSAIGRWVSEHPTFALMLAGMIPHLAASIVQIGYNAVQVQLNDEQQRAFALLVIAYNMIAYPVCLGTGFYLMWRIARQMPKLSRMTGPALDDLRRRALQLGWWVAGLGVLGWLPGAIIFPLVIDLAAGPLSWQTYVHFAVSFTLAGLIGVVFSYLCIQYVIFRAILPRLGNPDTHTPAKIRAEVRPLTTPFGPLVILACGVPLVGAVLLLTLSDSSFTFGFRVLVAGLIGAGVAGVGLAERLVRQLRRLVSVWQREGGESD